MNQDQAQTAVSVSAFVVAAIWAYRKLTEGPTGASSVPNAGHFIVGYGFTFVSLALMAQAAPAFGGMFAILVATGDTLANGQALVSDLAAALNRTNVGLVGGKQSNRTGVIGNVAGNVSGEAIVGGVQATQGVAAAGRGAATTATP
ncbi:MAG TPA: hypothetical protein VFI54_06340 [Solirubrobacteraceae bacterium]|nr:hypothetical protein [Solirubrobacteraceae bacterium]